MNAAIFRIVRPISLKESVILKKKGIKLGFLGYCDIQPTRPEFADCLAVRKRYKAGAAVYSDRIAQRDVRQLKVRKLQKLATNGQI